MKLRRIPIRYTFKWRIFFICLVFAFGMWSLIHLSKIYTSSIRIVVDYNQLTSNKILYGKKCDTIDAMVEATGFQLLRYKRTLPRININLNDVLLKQKGSYFWLPNRSQGFFKENLSIRRVLSIISTDTIFLDLDERVHKMVEINPQITFDIPKGYKIKNTVYSVRKVDIFGPQKLLRKIKEARTEVKKVKVTTSNTSHIVSLELPNLVTSPQRSIKLDVELERVTQKIIELPVLIWNLPHNSEVRIIPDRVEVAFTTSYSEYDKITKDDFEVICDLQNRKNFIRKLPLKFSKLPKNISQLQIKPTTAQVIVISK